MLWKHFAFCSIYFLVLFTSSISRSNRSDLRYDVSLDAEGTLQLFWDIDILTETITFRLEAQLKPHETLGFGFSDYGDAENADFVVYWRDATGKRHVQVIIVEFLPSVRIWTHFNYLTVYKEQ